MQPVSHYNNNTPLDGFGVNPLGGAFELVATEKPGEARVLGCKQARDKKGLSLDTCRK